MTDRVYPETAYKYGPRGAPNGAYYNVREPEKGQPSFQAPPPSAPEYYDPGYDGRPRRRNPWFVCLAWLCVTLVVLLVLLGIAALIFYLVARPKSPKYNVEDVRLTSFFISPSGTVSSGNYELSAVTAYTVQAHNPNKKIGIYYDNININVLSEGATIGHGTVSPFYQGHRSTVNIAGNLVSSNIPLASTVANALQSARSSGAIPLTVKVDVRARIKVGSWKSPHFWVHVRCNVNVNPDVTSGSQVIPNSKRCSVKR